MITRICILALITAIGFANAQKPYDGIWVNDHSGEIIQLDSAGVTFSSRFDPRKVEEPDSGFSSIHFPGRQFKIMDYGSCLFYWSSDIQNLIYFATFTDDKLITVFGQDMNGNETVTKFRPIDFEALNKVEKETLINPIIDPGTVWHMKVPVIEENYRCGK